MDLIQLQIRKTFYDQKRNKKAIAAADEHYYFLKTLQYLRDANLLTGVNTKDIPNEVWSHLIRGYYPVSELITCRKNFDEKLLDAIKKKD